VQCSAKEAVLMAVEGEATGQIAKWIEMMCICAPRYKWAFLLN
jgi:hypothetical protein